MAATKPLHTLIPSLRDGLPEALARYTSFPHALFDALGMSSAVLEADAEGTFVGRYVPFTSLSYF
jgi:hypothetical protein